MGFQNPKYINPYNFISNGDKKKITKDTGELLSGRIECSLEVKTPLFIGGTKDVLDKVKNKYRHNETILSHLNETSDLKAYDMFSYDGQNPVIPGSSLRGMIRSVYEAATNSCYSVLYDDEILSKRTGVFANKYCLLGKVENGYELYNANLTSVYFKGKHSIEINGEKLTDSALKKKIETIFKDGDKVYYDTDTITIKGQSKAITKILSKEKKANLKEGYILLGNDFSRKKVSKFLAKVIGIVQ